MKSIRFLFLLGLYIGAFHLTFSNAQTLHEAIQLALKQNNEIKALQQAVISARTDARAAFRRTLPTVDFSASYRHVTDVPQLNFPTSPFLPTNIRLGQYDTYEAGLSIRYVLFSGFAQKNKVALLNQKAGLTDIQLQKTQKEIAFKVISAYRNVQNKLLEQKVLQASLQRIEWQMKRAKALIEQGMALGLDSLSLKLAYLDAQKQLITTQGELIIAQQQLNRLIGQTIKVQPFEPTTIPSLQDTLYIQQTELYRQWTQQLQIQNTAIRLSQARYFPTLALFASYNYGKPGLDMIKGQWMQYGIWGVQFSWNLFTWQADRLQEQAARAKQEQIHWQKEAVKNQLKTQFEKALQEWQTLKKQQAVLEAALQVARQKMNMVKARYQQGMASATDFNEANLQLTAAELNVKRHYLRLCLKQNEIDFLSGKPLSQWSIP